MSISRSIERTFIESVRARNLLPEDSDIVAAVSGGGDSVALLKLLASFSEHMNWKLCVLHIDHGLRKDSREDARFVRTLAASMDLDFTLEETEPPDTGSIEDHFSRVRSEIYRKCAGDGKLVATGHTADDRAETLMMRLLEGAGLRGLGGMDYFGSGPVRRPLLDFSREQLRLYLESVGQAWLEDATNSEDIYLRNRIRHSVMPVLEEIHPGCSLALARSSANLSQWRDFTDSIIRDSTADILEGDTFCRESYIDLPDAVRIGVLWALSGRPRGGRLEIEKTDRWILTGRNGFHDLPGGRRITVEGDLVTIQSYLNSQGRKTK